MQKLVESYKGEWKQTLEDPKKRARFSHFVNSVREDDQVVFVSERGQKRPASPEERVQIVNMGGQA